MSNRYHKLLPMWAQDVLREAASVAPTHKNPRARDQAVDEAIHEVRIHIPQYFRPTKGGRPPCTWKEMQEAKKLDKRITGRSGPMQR